MTVFDQLKITRGKAYLFVVVVWALIFLPNLGRLEVQSNEPKRIMPAVHMIESGDYASPVLYGRSYRKKPPLINWMIAGMFKLTGKINEFTARIPSALMVLAFVTVLVLMNSTWLPLKGRFLTALFYMTTYAATESGRLIEIEATLMSLTGIVTIWWLNVFYEENYSKWKLWLVSGLVLGLGMLLKGPIILLFFYVMVLCVAFCDKRQRELLSWAHLAGLLVMVAVFMGWAWVLFEQTAGSSSKVTGTWTNEMMQQITPSKIKFGNWGKQIGMAIGGFMPWLLLAPFCFMKSWLSGFDDRQRRLFKSGLLAFIICLILVNLMPGTRARYSAPLCPLVSILAGLLVCVQAQHVKFEVWIRRILIPASYVICGAMVIAVVAIYGRFFEDILERLDVDASSELIVSGRLPLLLLIMFTAATLSCVIKYRKQISGVCDLSLLLSALAVCVILIYSVIAVPIIGMFDIKRPPAETINSLIDTQTPLYVYHGDWPYFFYLRRPVVYVENDTQLPDNDCYMLVNKSKAKDALSDVAKKGLKKAEFVGQTTYKRRVFNVYQLKKS